MNTREWATEELYHYGVLGMKWGVHRGNTAKAYTKASKKLERLDKKVTKKENKAFKKSLKADKKMASSFSTASGRFKANEKAKRASAKVTKKMEKAHNWYRKMEKTFENTEVKFTAEQVALGKRYADHLRDRYTGRY